MGTDIHGVLQRAYKVGGKQYWRTECEMERGRNYCLFAALAGVRNGYGFAGVPTHNPITPISEPRDWPDDFDLTSIRGRIPGVDWDEEEEELWLGDHSFSWLTLEEVINWDGWDQPLSECGYISREQYDAWDRKSPPEGGWSGGISGRDVVTVDSCVPGWDAYKDWTHVRAYWQRPLRETCETFLAWARYAAERTKGYDARIVFGFDS